MTEINLGHVVGPGVPTGGATGKVLVKKSDADYDTEWGDPSTSAALPLAGGTMSGAINMDGNKVSNLPAPTAGADAVPKGYADNIVVVSDTQPTAQENKLWVDTDAGSGTSYQIPTVAEMQAADALSAKESEIGIVITGARPSMVVSAGQYVIVRGSTISGVTDGLYTAVNALSPSTDVTAADLTAVTVGGLNMLMISKVTTHAFTISGQTNQYGYIDLNPSDVNNEIVVTAYALNNYMEWYVTLRQNNYGNVGLVVHGPSGVISETAVTLRIRTLAFN